MVIEINKDIDRYKESVVMGLTARQLVFSLASVVIGGSIVLFIYPYVGLTLSAYIAIPAVAPVALSGFYSYNGMTFMEMMRLKLYFMFGSRALTFVSTENEGVIVQARAAEAAKNKKKRKKMRGHFRREMPFWIGGNSERVDTFKSFYWHWRD